MSQKVSVRLSDDLLEQVDRRAEREDRSRSWMLERLLWDGLAEAENGRRGHAGRGQVAPVPRVPKVSESDGASVSSASPPAAVSGSPRFEPAGKAEKFVRCEIRHPMVPLSKCEFEMGHLGEHSWKT